MSSFFAVHDPHQNPHRGHPQVIVIGNFDGVHLGHRELLTRAREKAHAKGLPGVVVTFDPHPLAVLRPPHLRLFDIEDQQEQLQASGLDGVVYLSFSRDFSELAAADFLDRVIGPHFNPAVLIVGFNFRFGSGRSGTIETLKEWGQRRGCEVEIVEPVQNSSGVVSTSEIRKALAAGEVARARALLGRPFSLQGIVVHGESRGRGLGFPTANLHLEKVVTPKWGVYATRTLWGGRSLPSVTHLGPLPTFGDEVARLETHLLDFSEDIYGQKLRVEFIDKVRDVVKFSSVQELREQIILDVQKAREVLGAKV